MEFPDTALESMMQEAEATGKWVYSPYHQISFAPMELRAAWAEGKYRWGADNWEIQSPLVILAELQKEADTANRAVENFKHRIKEPL